MKKMILLSTFAALSCGLHAASDEAFLKKAAQSGMIEVRLGELAKTKAMQPGVKDFGAMMAADHGKANAELKSLAESKKVELPTQLDSKHQATVERLEKLPGAEFDKAYVDEMVKDHKMDVKEFEEASKDAKDADVKAFAEKTLPTLRSHLEKVEALQKEISK